MQGKLIGTILLISLLACDAGDSDIEVDTNASKTVAIDNSPTHFTLSTDAIPSNLVLKGNAIPSNALPQALPSSLFSGSEGASAITDPEDDLNGKIPDVNTTANDQHGDFAPPEQSADASQASAIELEGAPLLIAAASLSVDKAGEKLVIASPLTFQIPAAAFPKDLKPAEVEAAIKNSNASALQLAGFALVTGTNQKLNGKVFKPSLAWDKKLGALSIIVAPEQLLEKSLLSGYSLFVGAYALHKGDSVRINKSKIIDLPDKQ